MSAFWNLTRCMSGKSLSLIEIFPRRLRPRGCSHRFPAVGQCKEFDSHSGGSCRVQGAPSPSIGEASNLESPRLEFLHRFGDCSCPAKGVSRPKPVSFPLPCPFRLGPHEGEREGVKVNIRNNIESEPSTQTFMLHARPSPLCAST
jgi:hypothetical protein